MNLHALDFIVILAILSVLASIPVIFARNYTNSVSSFLAANRCAGRYLLTMGEGAAGLGVITIIASWEMYFKAGFPGAWWAMMLIPVGLVITLSGWITYRFRATRAMTMAQFFEIRYSRNFRIFSGIVAWSSGIINYGIFPAVTARCLIYFLGIPIYTVDVAGLDLNITLAIVMIVMLTVALTFALVGGQIVIMIVDFMQSQLFNITFFTVTIIFLLYVGWGNIAQTLKSAPSGQSMVNPFGQKDLADFNIWYFLMDTFMAIYAYRAWQGSQGFSCSAKSPHEARMAGVLANWRTQVVNLMYLVVPICAYVLLNNQHFSEISQKVHSILAAISDTTLQNQMQVPIALVQVLPAGVLGLMATSLLLAAICTDTTCLHSWGSIFIQDVVLPFRDKPLNPSVHLKWLRFSMIGVAVFAWFFSMLLPIKDYIFMFFQITGAIYLGGAGSAIIGGLYWKRGTTGGAFVGMITGSLLAVTGLLFKNIFWPNMLPYFKEIYPAATWVQSLPQAFPLNGTQMACFSALASAIGYVAVSLFTKVRPDFNMDKILHRGKYAIKEEIIIVQENPNLISRLFGISKEFTRGDKIIYFLTMARTVVFFGGFVVGSILYVTVGITDDGWIKLWFYYILFGLALSAAMTIWFMIGGIKDMKELIRLLKLSKADVHDDGTITEHYADDGSKTGDTNEPVNVGSKRSES